jgi:hypothetical protein
MGWERAHVNRMLGLRTAVRKEQWDESWPVIRQAVAGQRMQRRKQRGMARVVQFMARILLAVPGVFTDPPSRLPLALPATLPGSCGPSAHHPWKRALVFAAKRRAKSCRASEAVFWQEGRASAEVVP